MAFSVVIPNQVLKQVQDLRFRDLDFGLMPQKEHLNED